MKNYLTKVQDLQIFFDLVMLMRIPREDNSQADFLARLRFVVDEEAEALKQKVKVLTEPSILSTIKVLQVEQEGEALEWAVDIIQYLRDEKLPDDRQKA
jgi:methionine synthase II (cobalamin-independent)